LPSINDNDARKQKFALAKKEAFGVWKLPALFFKKVSPIMLAQQVVEAHLSVDHEMIRTAHSLLSNATTPDKKAKNFKI